MRTIDISQWESIESDKDLIVNHYCNYWGELAYTL